MKLILETKTLKKLATEVRGVHNLLDTAADQPTEQKTVELLARMLDAWLDKYDADLRIVPRHPIKAGRPGYITIHDVMRRQLKGRKGNE